MNRPAALSRSVRRRSRRRRKSLPQAFCRLHLEKLEARLPLAVELLSNINPGGSSNPTELTAGNGVLFFAANDGTNGNELWTSDGTSEGTKLVRNIHPTGNSDPQNLTFANGLLYFTADDGTNGRELWKSDGSASGTVLVKNIHPTGDSNPMWLVGVNGSLFFNADDGTNGRELWKSNGSEAGTVLVSDINDGTGVNPGDGGSDPRELTAFQGKVFFSADNGDVEERELWASDGTDAGTTLVKDIFSAGILFGSTPEQLTVAGGKLFFEAADTGVGRELFVSDGTTAGTMLVKDINPGNSTSRIDHLTPIGDMLFFAARDDNGTELWKSNGTEAGTVLVKDINPGNGSSFPNGLVDFNGTALFAAATPDEGVELWKSDGSAAGTQLVRDIFPGSIFSSPSDLTVVNGAVFFSATGSTGEGAELWRSDGTFEGTVLEADINTNPSAGSSPQQLTNVNPLYFSADDGINGREIFLRFTVIPLDFGDAPSDGATPQDVYPTLLADEGARHQLIVDGPRLGPKVDGEVDGLPDTFANGDDNDGEDDEDGIEFLTTILVDFLTNTKTSLQAEIVGPLEAHLRGWIDFDRSGSWESAIVLESPEVLNLGSFRGTAVRSISIPPGAFAGGTFARFRVSSDPSGVGFPTGLAPDGEVEDYAIELVPCTDQKTAAEVQVPAGGRTVVRQSNTFLEPFIRVEYAQADSTEDVELFAAPKRCLSSLTVQGTPINDTFVVLPVDLPITIDGGDGVDRVEASVGENSVTEFLGGIQIGDLPPITIRRVESTDTESLDFGDIIQEGFTSERVLDGARHRIGDGPRLGSEVDAEPDAVASRGFLAVGDDLDRDDEDGVVFPHPIVVDHAATIDVFADLGVAPVGQVPSGKLDAWIDFDDEPGFAGAGEQIANSLNLADGINQINFFVPANAKAETFGRFRVSRQGGLGPAGFAPDGEIEDYAIRIHQAAATGKIFVDENNNQQQDTSEPGLPNVPVSLTQNGVVTQTVTTDANGIWTLLDPADGLSSINAAQAHAYDDGVEIPGTPTSGRVENDVFADVEFALGAVFQGYDFTETGPTEDAAAVLEFLASNTGGHEAFIGRPGNFYLFTPEFDAFVEVEALPPGNGEGESNGNEVFLELYDNDLLPVVLGNGARQISAQVQTGEDYALLVTGHTETVQVRATFTPLPNSPTLTLDNLDTTGDGFIVPQDALVVINFLNREGPGETDNGNPLDVNADGFIVPGDVLIIINYLNGPDPFSRVITVEPLNGQGNGEGESAAPFFASFFLTPNDARSAPTSDPPESRPNNPDTIFVVEPIPTASGSVGMAGEDLEYHARDVVGRQPEESHPLLDALGELERELGFISV